MIASNYGLLLSLVLAAKPTTAADFVNKARCGDCWCIPDGGDTCPTDIVGITDTFSESDKLFSNFELANDKSDFLKLRSASGDVCYPFADTFNNVAFDNYPESGLEQCVFPDDNDDQVCGYVYDQTSPTCEGRKYRIQNFPSINDAMAGNAAILHQGGCGVCSSAQDFGARISTYGTLETESIKCATTYTFSRDFQALQSCYKNLGFTGPCATLWAHFAATSGSKCQLDCFPVNGVTEMNGPAPECVPSKCLSCQLEFKADFDRIAGIELPKAGITESIAYSCNDFYRIIHDPCLGFDTLSSDDLSPSNPVEVPSSDTTSQTTGDGSAGESIDMAFSTTALTLSLFGTVLVFV